MLRCMYGASAYDVKEHTRGGMYVHTSKLYVCMYVYLHVYGANAYDVKQHTREGMYVHA